MRMPQISGIDLIKKLQHHGFVVIRQKGSHIRLEKNTTEGIIKLTIPRHKVLKKGTLHHILKAAGVEPKDIF